jgi:ribosomal protein S18 acetylase RimI-like enzyme
MSKTSFSIRRATLDDVTAIARVHVKTWQVGYRGLMPDTLIEGVSEERRISLWRALLEPPAHGVFVAIVADTVAGFCDSLRSRDDDASNDTGEIAAIYVDPSYWGLGLGHALMAAGMEHARSAGHRSLTLWVLATNAKARHFYEREGFSADGAEKQEGRGAHLLHEVRYRRAL